jgi:hypothetical protein
MKKILIIFCLFFVCNLSDAKILKKKEIYDILNNYTKLYRSHLYGIAKLESSFRTNAIGDNGFSVGILQLHKTTIKGLYKKGLIRYFNKKRINLKKAYKLRYNPKFSFYVGEILFKDNMKIIKRYAKKYKIKLNKKRLEDLTIMSHNVGVSKCIYRRLLNKQKKNTAVDKYLKIVRKYMREYDAK